MELMTRRRMMMAQVSGLPSLYTQVTAIYNNGKSWLDLGMPIGSAEFITFDVMWNTIKNGTFFGAYNAGGSYSKNSFVGTFAKSSKAFYISSIAGLTFDPTAMVRYVIKWNGVKQLPTYNGTEFGRIGLLVNFTPNVNAFLCARNQSGTAGIRDDITLYGFSVDGKINLVPAIRKSDNEVGMYDTIRGYFLTNQGSGSFTVVQ